MLRVIFASCLALAACGTERIELVPDARDAATPDRTEDAAAPDTGTPDTGTPDTGTVDSGMIDGGVPDAGGECVCRYVACSGDGECVRTIGAGSTCDPRALSCTGAIGSCATAADCGGAGWMCTTSSTALDPC